MLFHIRVLARLSWGYPNFLFTVGGEGGELVNQNNSLVKFQITDSKLLSGCFSPTVHQSE